jgi:hypothetical protein
MLVACLKKIIINGIVSQYSLSEINHYDVAFLF